MLKLKYTCALVLFFLPFQLMAQGSTKMARKNRPVTESALIKNYSDSLAYFSDSIYRDTVSVRHSFSRMDTAPFFLPLTFYSNVANSSFGINDEL